MLQELIYYLDRDTTALETNAGSPKRASLKIALALAVIAMCGGVERPSRLGSACRLSLSDAAPSLSLSLQRQ
jgi:hypothetical protein